MSVWVWVIAAVPVVSGLGAWWAVRREERYPTSYTAPVRIGERGVTAPAAAWLAMSSGAQAAHDAAVLGAQAAAEGVVERAVDGSGGAGALRRP